MKITTNHNRREIIDASQLTAKEREDFDHLDWAAMERGNDSASFVRYKGNLWDLGDMEPGPGSSMPEELKGWNAYRSDTFFSGTVFRYVREDGEDLIICGTYYSE